MLFRSVALETGKEIPFEIRRVYYIYDTLTDVHRGYHAHKKLKQLLLCVCGQCTILLDNGYEKQSVQLNRPYEGIFLEGGIWREMYDFSEGTVLLALASELYDPSDYIRDYHEFLDYVRITGGN